MWCSDPQRKVHDSLAKQKERKKEGMMLRVSTAGVHLERNVYRALQPCQCLTWLRTCPNCADLGLLAVAVLHTGLPFIVAVH